LGYSTPAAHQPLEKFNFTFWNLTTKKKHPAALTFTLGKGWIFHLCLRHIDLPNYHHTSLRHFVVPIKFFLAQQHGAVCSLTCGCVKIQLAFHSLRPLCHHLLRRPTLSHGESRNFTEMKAASCYFVHSNRYCL
jgi:hypothetical protein